MVRLLCLSDTELSSRTLTLHDYIHAFGVCPDLISGEALASNQSLYLVYLTIKAAPKCISGSTSYLQV